MPKVTKKKEARALGLTCGVGSMLIGAKDAGFKVVGNVEWRKYYHSGTFEHNFPGAFMVHSLQEAPVDVRGIDLVMGHPECGNYSNLRTTSKAGPEDPGDIPLFAEMVARVRPRYFVMDNLPKSLVAVPMKKWHEYFPGYDLFPEWVSNYHYGNTQKNRRRFFLIGALKEERFVFVPGEFDHKKTLWDVIKDLPASDSRRRNHLHAPDDRIIPCGWAAHQLGIVREGNKITLAELKDYIRSYPAGKNFLYLNKKGESKLRPGYCKIKLHHVAPVMTGGGSALDNHYREDNLNPLTIRERARIQGCPDDFVFFPLDYLRDRASYEQVYKQTGKFMPVEFCRYVAERIMANMRGVSQAGQGVRKANPDANVDGAKFWYCENVGYGSSQTRACSACWLQKKCPKLTGRPAPEEAIQVRRKPRPAAKNVKKPLARKRKEPVPVTSVVTKVHKFSRGQGKNPVSIEHVDVRAGKIPKDYHCRCLLCKKTIGELRRADGSYYSRNDRRAYYDKIEQGDGGHIAKTPLHIARWAVQEYTDPGDWVFDPTAGSGTTLVESLVQGRNAAGMELQYDRVILANVRAYAVGKVRAVVGIGDARNVRSFLSSLGREVQLVVNNPPYFGDQSFPGPSPEGYGPEHRDTERTYLYDRSLPNLAFLKEGEEYWLQIARIYEECARSLAPGGRFVVGVKDQMRAKKPDQLHEKFGAVLHASGLVHEGTAFLRHHPSTLHLNTYEERWGVPPPRYQTILVYKKGRKR